MDICERIARLTPDRLALLERRLRGGGGARIPPRSGERRRLPLSFAQQRLWFLDRLQPASSSYNVATVVRLTGAIDLAALHRALHEVVRRHEALRTTFRTVDGQPEQVIAPRVHDPLSLVDLSSLPVATRAAAARRLMVEEAERSFDLEHGPLLRAHLISVSGDDHSLLLTMHHIISDAWSVRILLREIAVLYDAFRAGRPSPLPDLPIQYADFALWQQAMLQGERLRLLLDYWRGALEGAPTLLDLPLDRQRPAVQTYRGAVHNFTIPADLSAMLKALSQREGATLFMTVLGAFAALLHRLCGTDDLLIGTPIANRSPADVEGLIGFFTNTLVIRSRLRAGATFRELLEQVRQTTLDAFAHQNLPFEKLVEELQPARSLSHNPLFQVLFTLQSANDFSNGTSGPADASTDASAPRALADGDAGDTIRTAKFDLSFFVIESEHTLLASFEYNTDLWAAETIERLSGNLLTLLAAVAADADAAVHLLPLLTPHERRRIHAGNATAASLSPTLVHERFAAQAARTPHATAIIDGNERSTFAELNRRANRIAHFLRANGVGPESLVGLALPRSRELCAAVLGTLKAGGAYLPLDAALPRTRIEWILNDAKPHMVLDEALLRARAAELDRQPDTDPAARAQPDNLVYVLYTSGSTGRPKGVAMTHRAAANLIEWQVATAEPSQTTLQFASLSFDVAFQELFATWCSAATLVLVDEETRRDPDLLVDLLARERVARLFVPYVALRQLALARPRPLHLRSVITAGEPLRIDDRIAAFFASLSDCTLRNQYGPTESHVVTELVLRGDPWAWPEQPPIGRPIANVDVHVLDGAMQAVPDGVAGELYIGGVALARGYHGRADLTAECFIPHPDHPGRRLYRTGDVVRRRAGDLEFIGRRDHQVKIRGYRVELGEIEAILREHPHVREAAVILQDCGTEKCLAAFVAADGAGVDDLTQFLGARLPAYMVPARLEIGEALPLTASGKIDRVALARRVIDGAGPVDRFVAPRTPAEEQLASIWRDLLGIDGIGIHDNFFELGGHSLTATQVMSRIRDVVHIDLPLRLLFESPTIAMLAGAIEAATATAPAPEPAWPAQSKPDVDGLSEEEVDRLLLTMIAEQQQARPSMQHLDAMSDDEVDRLLHEMIAADRRGAGE